MTKELSDTTQQSISDMAKVNRNSQSGSTGGFLSFNGKTGQVDIQVQPIPDDSTHVTVSVLATFPTKSTFSAKVRRKVIVELPAEVQTDEASLDEDQGEQDEQE